MVAAMAHILKSEPNASKSFFLWTSVPAASLTHSVFVCLFDALFPADINSLLNIIIDLDLDFFFF